MSGLVEGYIDEAELMRRWCISDRTLDRYEAKIGVSRPLPVHRIGPRRMRRFLWSECEAWREDEAAYVESQRRRRKGPRPKAARDTVLRGQNREIIKAASGCPSEVA